MLVHLFPLLTLLSTFQHLQAEPTETALLLNNQPLDLEWQSCVNTVTCLKTNMIDRVERLQEQVPQIAFGEVPRARGFQLDLGTRLKVKVIRKDDGNLALRILANDNPVDQARGAIAEKQKIALIGFSMILFVLGVVSTTLKVNVFLALLGVAVGKILLLYVYTEHLIHHGHKHHHKTHPAIHVHRAPIHNYKYSPVIEPVPVVQQEVYHDFHHEPYHHDHHYDHHDHHDHHDDWIFGRKKKTMQL